MGLGDAINNGWKNGLAIAFIRMVLAHTGLVVIVVAALKAFMWAKRNI